MPALWKNDYYRKKVVIMDMPISYIHAPDECGWAVLGFLIGFAVAMIYAYYIHMRAWVVLNDLRACFPSWKFTRGRNSIIGLYKGKTYIVGGKWSSFTAVCDRIESIMEGNCNEL